MTKDQLSSAVSTSAMYSKSTVDDIIDTALDVITEELKKGNPVTISGFGTFKTVERKAKVGRNIRAGISVTIPAHTAPVFKASKVLKDKIYREVGV